MVNLVYLLFIGSLLSSCLTAPLLDTHESKARAFHSGEKPELFEGDIAKEWPINTERIRKRSIGNDIIRWPNGTVFYTIDSRYNETSRRSIVSALRKFEAFVQHGSQKCVRFVNRTFQENYVFITPEEDECYSWLGMRGSRQVTSLGSKCLRKSGKIIHEMMHVLGFLHEQSRFDRDEYVTVLWDNIKQGQEINFEKYDEELADTMALPYDYGSLMHYSPMAFSKNGNPTIAVASHGKRNAGRTDETAAVISFGQREAPSELDVQRVRLAYACATDIASAVVSAAGGAGT